MFNFEIRREPLFVKSGIQVEKQALIRVDTGDILGIVSPDYNLITHQEAIEKTENAFGSIGDFQKRKQIISKAGARIFIEYEFPGMAIDFGNDDKINPVLILSNSYDGWTGFGFFLGAYVFICSNGMRIGKGIFEVRHKHTTGLNINTIIENASQAFSMFNTNVKPRIFQMKGIQIDFVTRLNDIQNKNILPKKLVTEVSGRMAIKQGSEWDLYNVFTKFLTHDYSKSYERYNQLQELVSKEFNL